MVVTIQEYVNKHNGKKAMLVDSRLSNKTSFRSHFTSAQRIDSEKFQLNTDIVVFNDTICFIQENIYV